MSEPWGGKWTDLKLEVLGKYFQAFQTALKYQAFQTWYIDALAGDGKGNAKADLPLFLDDEDRQSAEALRAGAAALALGVSPAFDKYRLNEQSSKKRESLEALVGSTGVDKTRIHVSSADANEFILEVLTEIRSSNDRGIVLLDPFGMQVNWSTVAAIAAKGEQTKAWLDVWYLFPTMPVVRMLPKSGLLRQEWQDRLDSVLGVPEWRSEFYPNESRPDLFESSRSSVTRSASFDAVEAFVIGRLKGSFRGTVFEKPLRLGPSNKPIFSLFFASGNPSAGAKKLTNKLAAEIVGANQYKLL